MSRRNPGRSEGPDHRFGGDWTGTKLEILRGYLGAYTTVMKKARFKTAYIDAFAGTGYRSLDQPDTEGVLPFPDLAAEAPQELLEGSARIALQTEPRFGRYIFIEKDPERCHQLEGLRNEFPGLAADIRVKQGDANKIIQDLCKKNWENHRAVLFLDPYGMQVEWATIASVAETEAIDLWLLFPLGIGVNRLLPRSGRIPEGWRNRLNLLLGTEEWSRVLYREQTITNLFGDPETTVVKATLEEIGTFFVDRLRSVFPGVAPKPRVLENSMRCPLYLFCFAVGSRHPRAQKIALDIANHLLEKF